MVVYVIEKNTNACKYLVLWLLLRCMVTFCFRKYDTNACKNCENTNACKIYRLDCSDLNSRRELT